jgi:phosphohistidine phosphatase
MIKQFTLSRLFLFSAYHCFMKELMIVRHAKSSWEDDSLSDFERPLNERGQKEALSMAQQAALSEWRPDLIVCSTALRAQQTMAYFVSALDPDRNIEVRHEQNIYDATIASLLDIVNGLPKEANRVILFGHNPGFSKLLAFLTGEYYDMPTCACGLVQMEIEDWIYLYENCGTLKDYNYPRRSAI